MKRAERRKENELEGKKGRRKVKGDLSLTFPRFCVLLPKPSFFAYFPIVPDVQTVSPFVWPRGVRVYFTAPPLTLPLFLARFALGTARLPRLGRMGERKEFSDKKRSVLLLLLLYACAVCPAVAGSRLEAEEEGEFVFCQRTPELLLLRTEKEEEKEEKGGKKSLLNELSWDTGGLVVVPP